MKDMRITFDANLAGLDAAAWAERLEELVDDLGYFEPLGDSHMAAFVDAGPRLLVTFENAETIRKSNPGAEPRGFSYVRDEGWSHLALICEGDTWFRDPAVYRYFDRLIDDGFFEDFDHVVFHGANGCGYAACAFSVAAPGCTVLAIRPQATLDPRIAGFDPRYKAHRRLDFNVRYGFAPDMIDAAGAVFIAFDPLLQMDATHAALFTRPNMTQLRCYCLGDKLEVTLDNLDIHNTMIAQAMAGTLDRLSFAKIIRVRRNHIRYQRGIYAQMVKRGHPVLAANVAAHMMRHAPDAFFAEKLAELEAQGHMPTRPISVDAAE